MRVGIAVYWGVGAGGGAERAAAHLAQCLGDAHEVDIISGSEWGKRVHQSLKGIPESVKVVFRAVELAIAAYPWTRYDRVISFGAESGFLPKEGRIHWYQGDLAGFNAAVSKEETVDKEARRLNLAEWLEKRAGEADAVVVVSKKVGDEVKRYYQHEKDHVIHNCADTALFSISDSEPEGRIVFVGRLEYAKGADVINKIVETRQLETELLIVAGQGSNEKMMSRLSRAQNVVVERDVPYQRMPEYYQKGSVFFLPTRFEGLELSTIEAMCCGLVPVVTNVGVMAELRSLGCEIDLPVLEAQRLDDSEYVHKCLEAGLLLSKEPNVRYRMRRIAKSWFSCQAVCRDWRGFLSSTT